MTPREDSHSARSDSDAVVCPSVRVAGDTAVEFFSPSGLRYSIRAVGIGHPWHTIGPTGGRISTHAEIALARAVIAADLERKLDDPSVYRPGSHAAAARSALAGSERTDGGLCPNHPEEFYVALDADTTDEICPSCGEWLEIFSRVGGAPQRPLGRAAGSFTMNLGQNDGMPEGLFFSERMLWKRAEQDNDQAVLDVLARLARLRERRYQDSQVRRAPQRATGLPKVDDLV